MVHLKDPAQRLLVLQLLLPFGLPKLKAFSYRKRTNIISDTVFKVVTLSEVTLKHAMSLNRVNPIMSEYSWGKSFPTSCNITLSLL